MLTGYKASFEKYSLSRGDESRHGKKGKASGYLNRGNHFRWPKRRESKDTRESSSCKRWVDRITVGIHKEAAFRRYSRYLYEPLVLSEMESKILV